MTDVDVVRPWSPKRLSLLAFLRLDICSLVLEQLSNGKDSRQGLYLTIPSDAFCWEQNKATSRSDLLMIDEVEHRPPFVADAGELFLPFHCVI